MALFNTMPKYPTNRRRFLKTGLVATAGLALYSGEVERHWVEIARPQIRLRNLPSALDGLKIAQLSDIHLDEYTEPAFLRHVVRRVNQLQPDVVVLTGDFVSDGPWSHDFAAGAAWHCANLLRELECSQVYAVLGNHDVVVGALKVTQALTANGIPVLRNNQVPFERAGARLWLAGVDDPVIGNPDPELAIPASIRNVEHEPVVLLCHAPDYVDRLLERPVGGAVDLVLSGHTHGGQIRLPLMGALELPEMGRKYIEGLFRLGNMQLYVNRGIGTVGVPFRLACPPEITLFTLRAAV
jgi:predicted MPP superfamily phosphohydrolase